MQTVEDFAFSAKTFCLWAEALEEGADVDVDSLLVMLSSLLHFGLQLPSPEICEIEDESEAPDLPGWKELHKKFSSVPLQYYWEIFDPHDFDEEPVTGDLHDDLADIYLELKAGLILHMKGLSGAAAYHWAFSFNIHWGEHITSAIRALYMFER